MYQSAIAGVFEINPLATLNEVAKVLRVGRENAKRFREDFKQASHEKDIVSSMLAVGSPEQGVFTVGDDAGDYLSFPYLIREIEATNSPNGDNVYVVQTGIEVWTEKDLASARSYKVEGKAELRHIVQRWQIVLGDCEEAPLLNADELGMDIMNVDAGGSQYYRTYDRKFDAGFALSECNRLYGLARYGEEQE